nr:MAG: hypothetical protein [Microvirus sp.]
MSKRKPMSASHSKKVFTSTAKKVHPKNLIGKPMRGGIRL